jgi:arylsulfatase A-like enzyme
LKKNLILAACILSAAFLLRAFWPLKSNVWDIDFDPELQKGKDDYLRSLSAVRQDRPNVVIIVADDLGLTDISLYGSPHLVTPNIDSIGTDGVVFTQAYATAPICSPSRAGLLTGRYQNRYGFESQPMNRYARSRLEYWINDKIIDTSPMYLGEMGAVPKSDQIKRQGVPPTEILLSEALSSAGYRNDAVGKWHLGYGSLQHPLNRGFQSFFGFLEAFSWFIDPDLPEVESWQFDEFSEKYIWGQQRKNYSAIQRDGVEVDEVEHLTDAFAREAELRIREAAGDERPFFLYLPFSAPHTPFQALTRDTSKFSHVEDPKKRIYYALIAQLDAAVGKVLQTLEETGEAGNTIVIFTSDNGGATYTGATGNDPLRGGKMSHFEGGLSVPLMIRWPVKITKPVIEYQPVMLFDLFTTVLAAAGIALPEDRVIDGIDLLSREAMSRSTSRPLFWRSDYNHIVQHDGWKLIVNGKDGKTWLFNIREDREENRNLAPENPEKVRFLMEMFSEWNREMAEPLWPRVMDYYYDEDGEGYWFST